MRSYTQIRDRANKRKEEFLKGYSACFSNRRKACSKMNLNYSTVNYWLKKDASFKERYLKIKSEKYNIP